MSAITAHAALDKTRLDHLADEVVRAWKLAEAGKPREGLAVARAACAELARAGGTSAFALWQVYLIAKQLGDLAMAYEHLTLAVEADPLARPVRSAFTRLTRQLQEALADGDRAATDSSTPRLHGLLVRAGEADLGSTMAMVRWCSATGAHDRAHSLAEAMTTLHPLEGPAWACLAEAARAAGNHDLSVRASAEAAALTGPADLAHHPEVAHG